MAVEVKIWRMRDESNIPALQEESDVVSESGVRFRDTVDGRRERHTCSSGKIGHGVILGDDNARRGGRGGAASLVMGRGPPRGCWMVLVNCRDFGNKDQCDGDLEGGTVFSSTREVWAGLAALLSLPLLISLLLHPNCLALAIQAHVPKTVHPWVAPLENPASEVASNKIKLGSLHKVDSAHRIFNLLAPSRVTGPSHLSSHTRQLGAWPCSDWVSSARETCRGGPSSSMLSILPRLRLNLV
ncbi:hypothetical protein BD769DRAFT_1708725 [Suillus cothurnatus]|nr:hypothetical protein BD769DRAFT_1708725 [Suillus cothurnatus]